MMKLQDIRNINVMPAKLLERIYRDSCHHQVRQRAHCLLLIRRGIQVEALQKIFQVSDKTIYTWANQWESESLVGLDNKPGQGRKRDEWQERHITLFQLPSYSPHLN